MNNAILTSTVIAAMVTAIANIISIILNNKAIKSRKKQEYKNNLIANKRKYLYDLQLKWQENTMGFEAKGKDINQLRKSAEEFAIESFFVWQRRFRLVSPLIDDKYKEEAIRLSEEAEKLFNDLCKIEIELKQEYNKEKSKKHDELFKKFCNVSVDFVTEIEKSIYLQLELFWKNDIA